ncbi:MAG: formate dehydrogenase accessory sulfurtransferase FdhD [Pseudomonadota bacterium]
MDALTHGRATTRAVQSASQPGGAAQHRVLPQEVPVAMVFDGSSAAVMLATPADLEDFAYGFALTEGFISGPADIAGFEVVPHGPGIEARFWLSQDRSAAVTARRRSMAGPVGCGLCGLESLEAATREVPRLPPGALAFSREEILNACEDLRAHQPLHDETHAVHGAGFMLPGQGIVAAREDVGRHNALDKLIGSVVRGAGSMDGGAVVITSRISVELVQKCAVAGCGAIVAVSAPTAYAMDVADAAGIALVQGRRGRFEVFTHAQRLGDACFR